MNIALNGQPTELPPGTTVADVIRSRGSMRGSAAAVDGEVIPRAEWETHELSDGQSIELITAVQGG